MRDLLQGFKPILWSHSVFCGMGSSRMHGWPRESISTSSCKRVYSLGYDFLIYACTEPVITSSIAWRFLLSIWSASKALVTTSSALNCASLVREFNSCSTYSRSCASRFSISLQCSMRFSRKPCKIHEQEVAPISLPEALSERPNSVIASSSNYYSRGIILLLC